MAEQVQPQPGVLRVRRRGLQVLDHHPRDEAPHASYVVDALELRQVLGCVQVLVGLAQPRRGEPGVEHAALALEPRVRRDGVAPCRGRWSGHGTEAIGWPDGRPEPGWLDDDMASHPTLDLRQDVVSLTQELVDIESVSGNEKQIADAIEAALGGLDHLDVRRFGHTLVARTDQGREERVVIAGHIDTVPLNDNLPARRDETRLNGLGACDMKGGLAVALRTAATMAAPNRDVTYLFYECEEVEAERNGLEVLSRTAPDLLQADFAILMEPSDGVVEAGCQGTIRVDVTTRGERAHSARWWTGVNAIHGAGE